MSTPFSSSPTVPSDWSLDASIRYCQELTRRSGSNFVPAFRLLPAEKRRAMEILYAFNRYTDDLADEAKKEIAAKRKSLDNWKEALTAVLGGDDGAGLGIGSGDGAAFRLLGERFPACSGILLLPGVRFLVERFGVPGKTFFQVLEGVITDLEPHRFGMFSEAADYCHQVATAVGYASLAIWGTKEPIFSDPVIKAAQGCGLAFQWTNILRDLAEDYRSGRLYLPLEDLAQVGLTEERLGMLVNCAVFRKMKRPPIICLSNRKASREYPDDLQDAVSRFEQLMTIQRYRAEMHFQAAATLVDFLDRDGQRIFKRMYMAYHRLFLKIADEPLSVLRRRLRLSFWDKLMILWRS